MQHFVVVSATDFESGPIFEMLGGRAISSRMGVVRWSGTAEQLSRWIARWIPHIILIACLATDCLIFGA